MCFIDLILSFGNNPGLKSAIVYDRIHMQYDVKRQLYTTIINDDRIRCNTI
jgi:hypothetical protein